MKNRGHFQLAFKLCHTISSLDIIWMLLPLTKKLFSLNKTTFQTRCFEF